MQILITGSHGQLGTEIRQLAGDTPHQFIFTDIEELDITSEPAVRAYFLNHEIDLVINCAAYTAVDKAESEIDKALDLNASAPRILAETCHNHKAILIHISTDFVFDGQHCTPYSELDPAAPVNVYGQTKLEGENRALRENPRTLIIRTSWLYAAHGQNFVKTMLRLGAEKEELRVIFDQVGTPTWSGDLAMAILRIIDRLPELKEKGDVWGIYHYSNEGVASWYDFADEIFRIRNMDIRLVPVRTSAYPTPAQRPAFSVMDKQKIKSTFRIHIPHWKDSLKACLDRMDV